MDRRYQAFGKARISVNRRMSYLKEAEPISVMAASRKKAGVIIRFGFTKCDLLEKRMTALLLPSEPLFPLPETSCLKLSIRKRDR